VSTLRAASIHPPTNTGATSEPTSPPMNGMNPSTAKTMNRMIP
jgi:hypothetical protein